MIEIIWPVIAGIFILYSIICCYFIKKFKKEPLIVRRGHGSMLLQVFASIILFSMICFREYNKELFPCVIYIFVINIFTPLYFLPLFKQAISLDLLYKYNAKNKNGFHNSAYTSQRKNSNGNMLIISSIVLLIHICILGVELYFASMDADITTGCQWADSTEFIILGVFATIYGFGFILVLHKIKNYNDPFKLSIGLKKSFCVSLIIISVFLVFNIVPALWFIDSYVPFSSLILLMIVILSYYNIFVPLKSCTKLNYKELINEIDDISSFDYTDIDHYMRNPIAYDKLSQFCKEKQIEIIKKSAQSKSKKYISNNNIDSDNDENKQTNLENIQTNQENTNTDNNNIITRNDCKNYNNGDSVNSNNLSVISSSHDSNNTIGGDVNDNTTIITSSISSSSINGSTSSDDETIDIDDDHDYKYNPELDDRPFLTLQKYVDLYNYVLLNQINTFDGASSIIEFTNKYLSEEYTKSITYSQSLAVKEVLKTENPPTKKQMSPYIVPMKRYIYDICIAPFISNRSELYSKMIEEINLQSNFGDLLKTEQNDDSDNEEQIFSLTNFSTQV